MAMRDEPWRADEASETHLHPGQLQLHSANTETAASGNTKTYLPLGWAASEWSIG